MKKIIFLLIFVVPVINLNVNAQSKTNLTNPLASKPKVSEKTGWFNENLNIALLSRKEVAELVKYAIENYNNNELSKLLVELKISSHYEFAPILIKAMLSNAKTDEEKAHFRCYHAATSYITEWKKSKFSRDFRVSDETQKALQNAINTFPEGRKCKNPYSIMNMASAGNCLMKVTCSKENDLSKAWDIYKKCKIKIDSYQDESCKLLAHKELNHGLTSLNLYLPNSKGQIKAKVSISELQEIQKYIEKLSEKELRSGKSEKLEILKILKQYESEVTGTSSNDK